MSSLNCYVLSVSALCCQENMHDTLCGGHDLMLQEICTPSASYSYMQHYCFTMCCHSIYSTHTHSQAFIYQDLIIGCHVTHPVKARGFSSNNPSTAVHLSGSSHWRSPPTPNRRISGRVTNVFISLTQGLMFFISRHLIDCSSRAICGRMYNLGLSSCEMLKPTAHVLRENVSH